MSMPKIKTEDQIIVDSPQGVQPCSKVDKLEQISGGLEEVQGDGGRE